MSSERQQLVWVHGWASWPGIWRPVMEYLPGLRHTCFCYGKTPEVASWKAELQRLISEDCIVVGWSMGGMLALECAQAAAGVALIGSTLKFTSEDPAAGWPPRVLARMRRRLAQAPEATVRDFEQAMFTQAEVQAGALRRYANLTKDEKGVAGTAFSLPGLEAGLAYLAGTDLHTAPSALAGSLLWLHGTSDPICPPSSPKPGPIHWLSDAGHVPHLMQPELVAKRILEFCGECERR